MRILQVITDDERRGAQVFACDLDRALSSLGADVETVALHSLGATLDVEPLGHTSAGPATIRSLRRRARGADIVFAHGGRTLLVTAIATLGVGTPVVYRQISDPRFWADTLTRRLRVAALLRLVDHVVALAPEARAALRSHYRLRDRRITTIPNGVDAKRFSPASEARRDDLRAELGIGDELLVVCLSALAPEKAVDVAVDAVRGLHAVQLVVAGDGPERDALVARAAGAPVRFLGSIAAPEDLLRAADVLVLPTRSDSMPAVLIEAALTGVVPVSSPVGDVGEIIHDDVDGVLVHPMTPAGYRQAIISLRDDEERRHRLGAAARRQALDRFEIARVAGRWLVMAEGLVGRPRDGGTKRLRVIHLIDSLAPGGAEQSLVELLPDLRDRGLDPSVVVLSDRSAGLDERVRELGFDLTTLPGGPPHRRALALRELLRRERADLLHTTLFGADTLGRLATLGSGVPVLTSLVNTSYDPVRRRDPRIRLHRLRLAQALEALAAHLNRGRFHAITDAVADAATETLGIRPGRIAVVPRSRDRRRLGHPSDSRRAEVRRGLSIPDDARVVLHVGREEFQKAHDVLLTAAERFLLDGDVHLVLAGRIGAASSTIDEAIARLPPDRVHRLGHRDDVPDLLAAADLFVFPSRYEGLGGSVLEAMAMSVPTVVSDLAPLREILGDDGRYVPVEDDDALAVAVTAALAEDDGRRRARVEQDLARFEERYGHQQVVEAMMSLIRGAAGDQRRNAR